MRLFYIKNKLFEFRMNIQVIKTKKKLYFQAKLSIPQKNEVKLFLKIINFKYYFLKKKYSKL